jgi:hypothetical protein
MLNVECGEDIQHSTLNIPVPETAESMHAEAPSPSGEEPALSEQSESKGAAQRRMRGLKPGTFDSATATLSRFADTIAACAEESR